MNTARSPFRPSFGANPPSVQGRAAVVDAVLDALGEGSGSPARISLVSGVRGIGKTIVLNAVEAESRRLGWLVLSETVTSGLLDRLESEHVPEAWRALRGERAPDPLDPRARRTLSGLSIPGGLGGATFSVSAAEGLPGLRANLAALCDALEARGAGLLISLDEVHHARGGVREQLQTLAGIVQHLWREGRAIAFVGAGLPSAVQEVLSDEVMTFLRRAERFDLDLLTADEVADALHGPVVDAGRDISDEALGLAVATAAGYPFLVQLVGDLAWRADPATATITRSQVGAITERAVRELGSKVHRPAVAGLSARDVDVLVAMLPDRGPSAVSDLLTRLDVDHAWFSRYRRRLIAAGLLQAPSRGRLSYAVPYLGDYLRTLED